MTEEPRLAEPAPDARKAEDGLLSAPQVSRIAEIPTATFITWLHRGMIEPTNAANIAPGSGHHRRFDLRDLICVLVFAELRRAGVLMRHLREIQTTLREEYNADWASARLALILRDDGRPADVVLLNSERDRKELTTSLLERPNQTILGAVALSPIVKRAKSGYRAALREAPAIRGARKKASAGRAQVVDDVRRTA